VFQVASIITQNLTRRLHPGIRGQSGQKWRNGAEMGDGHQLTEKKGLENKAAHGRWRDREVDKSLMFARRGLRAAFGVP
jgi:hypothetical protein